MSGWEAWGCWGACDPPRDRSRVYPETRLLNPRLYGRGLRNGAKALPELGAAGVAVTVSTLDITVADQECRLITLCADAQPLGGDVFHLAMYQVDKLFASQARLHRLMCYMHRPQTLHTALLLML